MNLNMLIDSLCNFKIKFSNDIEVSNMPLEIQVGEGRGFHKVCKFKGIALDEYGKKIVVRLLTKR